MVKVSGLRIHCSSGCVSFVKIRLRIVQEGSRLNEPTFSSDWVPGRTVLVAAVQMRKHYHELVAVADFEDEVCSK